MMQRPMDDRNQPRRLNAGEQYPPRMLAPAGQRFGEVGDIAPSALFSIPSYQVSTAGHPTQALHHAALGVAGAGATHHPSTPAVHAPTLAPQAPAPTQPLPTPSGGQVNLDLFGDAMQVVNTSSQALPPPFERVLFSAPRLPASRGLPGQGGSLAPLVARAASCSPRELEEGRLAPVDLGPRLDLDLDNLRQACTLSSIGARTFPELDYPMSHVSATGAAATQPAVQPTLQQPPQQQQQVQQQQQQQQFQRLKVEDALSYLDQVKLQFGNQPQVYNDFLDIMKEFKSQSIDTPGVINRVSNLFKGHADLIVGFNTFLPPGYKIEVQSEMINVHQPGQTMYTIHSSTAMVSQPQQPQQPTPPKAPTPAAPSVSPLNAPAAAHHTYHSPRPAPTPPEVPPTPPVQPTGQPAPGPANQPVEFNHAINYVNKIKNRFHGQPEIYKQFLEILHTYQKEQRNLKENQTMGKVLTESEVYAQVARLFENQKDLLTEFGQFLPDANGSFYNNAGGLSPSHTFQSDSSLGVRNDHSSTVKKVTPSAKAPGSKAGPVKRPSSTSGPPTKKSKLSSGSKDFSVAQASQHGTLSEFYYFDKVRKSLHNQEVYDNFLRCVQLFNCDVLNRAELVQLTQVFFVKFPELHKWFKDFLDYKESGNTVELVPHGATAKERISGELAMEIDFTTCKRFGASYRSLPKSYVQPRCSGRTQLCREVLNDTYVSFPSWSEDSTFVTSRKTQYEEHIYKCEDERFELDVIIETNLSAIRVLESVKKKLERMSPEDQAKFRLDNTLGGNSEVLTRKAIQRLYGDKAGDIIDGLKKNPVIAVPLVLRRLRAKEEEWREARHGFNKIWREQNEKFYLKSLDHQGLNFKQSDIKAIRSKQLLNEIEQAFDERAEQMTGEENSCPAGPHLTFTYSDPSLIDDVTGLIMHHMKRHTGIHKEEKTKIKTLLLHFLPDMFHVPRGDLSDDEGDEMETDEGEGAVPKEKEVKEKEKESQQSSQELAASPSKPTMNGHLEEPDDDVYSLAFLHSNWYLFFRLHHMAAERLHKINSIAQEHIQEAAVMRKERKESTAIALRLKQPLEVEPEEYYSYFLDMVKSLLDGNLESGAYEDQLREIFGLNAYIAFTMDKIIMNIVRQLQHITSDEVGNKVNLLFQAEVTNGATGGRLTTQPLRSAMESAYQRKAEQLLVEDSCFKIMLYKQGCRMTIEMLDVDAVPSEDPGDLTLWNDYIEKYAHDTASADLSDRKPVFLSRNLRQFTEKHESRQSTATNPEESDSDVEREKEGEGGLQRSGALASAIRSHEKMGCHFPPNSYKRYFIHNSGSTFYRTRKITQARESHKAVTLLKHTRFDKFLTQWRRENVSCTAEEQCQQWLLGKGGAVTDMRPCKTSTRRIFHSDKAPYYQYSRYHVEFYDTPRMTPAVLAPPPPISKPSVPSAESSRE